MTKAKLILILSGAENPDSTDPWTKSATIALTAAGYEVKQGVSKTELPAVLLQCDLVVLGNVNSRNNCNLIPDRRLRQKVIVFCPVLLSYVLSRAVWKLGFLDLLPKLQEAHGVVVTVKENLNLIALQGAYNTLQNWD